nr:uncharacterized protein LOC117683582 [Crassostrea gigas]
MFTESGFSLSRDLCRSLCIILSRCTSFPTRSMERTAEEQIQEMLSRSVREIQRCLSLVTSLETCLTDDQTFQALIDQITDLKTEKNVELRFIWMDMIHDIIETKVKKLEMDIKKRFI